MKVTYNMACHRSYKHLLRQWIRTDSIYCTRLQPLLQGTYSEISCGSGDEPEYALPKMDRHFPPRSLPPPYHLQHLETSLLDASNSNVYQVAATLTHYPSPNHDGRYETTVKVISTHKYPHHLSQFRSLSDSAPFA